jgi:hypothetical protein
MSTKAKTKRSRSVKTVKASVESKKQKLESNVDSGTVELSPKEVTLKKEDRVPKYAHYLEIWQKKNFVEDLIAVKDFYQTRLMLPSPHYLKKSKRVPTISMKEIVDLAGPPHYLHNLTTEGLKFVKPGNILKEKQRRKKWLKRLRHYSNFKRQ